MNKIVIINNKKCQLILQDNQAFNEIYLALSFKLEGIEFTPAFKMGRWNGINYLMTKKGIFPSGLLSMVLNKLNELGIAVITEDKRPTIEMAPELDITQRLKEIGKAPREHQIRILEAMAGQQKGIIRACTGSGKTLTSAMATAKFNKPTIIYVIGLDLLQQFHDLFSSIFDEKIGFIGNGVCDIQRINIASIWSIGRALGMQDKDIIDDEIGEEKFNDNNTTRIVEMLKQTKLHIFDESHVVTTGTIKAIYQTIDPEYIFGMSGTPYREDGSDLLITGILGEKIIDVSASELIEKGLLIQPIIKFVSVDKQQGLSKETYPTVYKKYVVENPERNALILREVKQLVEKKYKVLVLFKQVKHGKILFELLQLNNIRCEMLYGNDSLDHRNEVKEMINDGEIDVILASTIFDLGVDVPILNALVLAGSGKSSIRTLQRVGRIIRYHPQKRFAAVVDFYDNAKYLKAHSIKRCETYCQEKGFKVYKSKDML